ncbi:MAG: 1,4-dihydroxy-2-naphthoate polyprenyltransferase [Jatrophihabitans sp.]
MATVSQWVSGARPRTLPAAVAPVLVGTGVAANADGVIWLRAVLALGVSVGLQIAVNYANDYSDGVRGTDAVRVGPFRLTGSGAAVPAAVRTAAVFAFGIAAALGVILAAETSWWLIAVGAASIAAAWLYTGGPRPYGYIGLGEVFVFAFFGLVAVCGTTFVQLRAVPTLAVAVAVAMGLLACAILVINNLRDIPSDAIAGKRTLAVRIGDHNTRLLYVSLLGGAFVVAGLVAVLIDHAHWAAIAFVAAPLAVRPVRTVLHGASGRDLIAVLGDTGRLQLAYAILLAAGLAVR